MKRIIFTVVVVVISIIIYSLWSAENVNSLQGDFKELDFVRNENNTGPVRRVYAYQLSDTLWSEMKKHTDLLPHSKYGSTEVFYFLDGTVEKSELNVSLKGLNKEAKSYCIAHGKKDGQSRISFIRDPFSSK